MERSQHGTPLVGRAMDVTPYLDVSIHRQRGFCCFRILAQQLKLTLNIKLDIERNRRFSETLSTFFVDVDVPKFFQRWFEDVESVGSVGSVPVVWLHFKASQVCWTSHCRFFQIFKSTSGVSSLGAFTCLAAFRTKELSCFFWLP